MTTSTPRLYLGLETPIQSLAAWGTAEAPPKEFLVFKFGQNHATLGGRREVVTLTPKRANAIVSEWKRRRISGAFDYEHAVTEKNPNGTPAGGWFSLAVRPDGLWAVGIQWTDRALKYFRDKEYRYFSPYFGTTSNGEVTTLYNIALTNWPATDAQRPLIALSWAMRRYTMEPLSIEQLKAKAQELVDTFSAKGELMDLVLWLDAFQRGGVVADPMADPMVDPLMVDASAAPEGDTVAVAQAAYKFTGFTELPKIQGAFHAYSQMKVRCETAEGKLRQITHSANVKQALDDGKLEPANKDKALAMDPGFFEAYISIAPQVIDREKLTPNSRIAQGAKLTKEDYAKDPKLIAHVNKLRGQGSMMTVDDMAEQWSALGTPFIE